MKNIFILPTDQPSRLWVNSLLQGKLELSEETLIGSLRNRYIYITSEEELPYDNSIFATGAFYHRDAAKDIHIITKDTFHPNPNFCSRIILTTDDSLFKYGVQAIDDEFLEWFVKNPTCEFVEVVKEGYKKNSMIDEATSYKYKIIIPKEEPKPDLEKEMFRLEQELDIPSAIRWHNSKPEQKMQYSEDDMIEYSDYCLMCSAEKTLKIPLSPKEWFNQFHKKK
jgi:hypothetical protein